MLTVSFVERRLDEERQQQEAKRREREEQHLFLTVKVCPSQLPRDLSFLNVRFQIITDETFTQHLHSIEEGVTRFHLHA